MSSFLHHTSSNQIDHCLIIKELEHIQIAKGSPQTTICQSFSATYSQSNDVNTILYLSTPHNATMNQLYRALTIATVTAATGIIAVQHIRHWRRKVTTLDTSADSPPPVEQTTGVENDSNAATSQSTHPVPDASRCEDTTRTHKAGCASTPAVQE